MSYAVITIRLQENLTLFKAEEDSDIWKAYVDYVDEITVDGFFNIIHCSLQYLLENTDVAKANQDVLFEAKLELQVFYFLILTITWYVTHI